MALRKRMAVGPIRVQRVIDAPADDIWALFANPHRHPDLDGDGMARLQPGSVYGPQRLQAGDTFGVHMRKGPIPYYMNLLCLQSRPGEEVAWKTLAPAFWRWRFKALGEDRTLVTGEWVPTNRLMAPVFAALNVMTANHRGLTGTLDRLEEMVAESPNAP